MTFLQQTRELHEHYSVIIGLREQMNIHKLSFSELERYSLKTMLADRVRHVTRVLDYHMMISESLMEQHKNLLTLVGIRQ
jgi:hypothetical protein